MKPMFSAVTGACTRHCYVRASANQLAANVLPIIREIQAAGRHESAAAIAVQLNARNPTACGDQGA
jgi:hypothetical protein